MKTNPPSSLPSPSSFRPDSPLARHGEPDDPCAFANGFRARAWAEALSPSVATQVEPPSSGPELVSSPESPDPRIQEYARLEILTVAGLLAKASPWITKDDPLGFELLSRDELFHVFQSYDQFRLAVVEYLQADGCAEAPAVRPNGALGRGGCAVANGARGRAER
jgi:hypothetical protein